MKMFSLECPGCHANLSVEDGLDTFYCKYCGKKIMMEGMSKSAYKAKVQIKQMEHEEIVKGREYEQERYKLEHEEKRQSNKFKNTVFAVIGAVILFFVVFYVIPAIDSLDERMAHEEKIEELKVIENEVESAIQSGDYDLALFKAHQLICDDSWSYTEVYAWDDKRKAYISMIETMIYEEEIADPNNVFMPAGSETFVGKKYSAVVEQLSSLGFTNISTQPAFEKASLINKANTIEHVLVGGQTTFTNEDYFAKDTQIIIYYYAK